jgi:3-hydroxy-3-methylglutaryl CoA synthase
MPFAAPVSAPTATRILGVGHYQPSTVVTNADLIARGVDTDDEWIRTRVGIAERRYADPGETVVDMAENAGSKALAAAGVAAGDIDLVITATCTMPTPVPAAAAQLASRLGIAAPGADDVYSGCSGFVYALNVASAAVQVATSTRSMSSVETPLAASALLAACSAMSTTVSSGSAQCRSAMPTRVLIHSSSVSTPRAMRS